MAHHPAVDALKQTSPSNKPLRLTLAIGDYDRTRRIIDGTIKPAGIELHASDLGIADFCLKPVYEQYDVTEMSFSWYVMARCRGLPVMALPVFPLRMPVLAFILVRKDSTYYEPKDLIGKRIGVPAYRLTVNLWLRGIFQDYYQLAPDQVKWVTCAQTEGAGYSIPEGIDVSVAADSTPEQLLERGEVDAVWMPELPLSFVKGETGFRRLFRDSEAELHNYVRRTGILPITHTLVVNESLSKREPWIAKSLFDAFSESQRQSDEYWLTEPKRLAMADMVFHIEKNYAAYGEDAWSHGVTPNRYVIDTFLRYAYEQGYTPRRMSVDELFLEPTPSVSHEVRHAAVA